MSFGQANNGFWQGDARQRSKVVQLLWGAVAFFSGVAAVITFGAGTFAEPEWERIELPCVRGYDVNTMRFLYLATSVLLPMGGFSLWKAAHRGGLGVWRATARPALMSGATAFMLLGMVFTAFVGAGEWQAAGLGVSLAAGLGLFLAWILRGPQITLRAGDEYWSRAYAVLAAVAALGLTAGSIGGFNDWFKRGRQFELPKSDFTTMTRVEHSYNTRSHEFEKEEVAYRVPQQKYEPRPVIAALMGLLALGCFSEMRSRLKLATRARREAF